jgi:hypothetical protein
MIKMQDTILVNVFKFSFLFLLVVFGLDFIFTLNDLIHPIQFLDNDGAGLDPFVLLLLS